MKLSCDVIVDLIPLVKDGVASDDSNKIVYEHLKSCESCNAEFQTFASERIDGHTMKDEKIIFAIKRSIFITQLTILILGTVVGVALSNSMGLFYNFIIMPAIGGISLIAFKKKWYWMMLAVFMFTFLWQSVLGIISEGVEWEALYRGLYYSLIYTVLLGLGAITATLLKFTFKREEGTE
ncbi:zf-HC2 domain-containing protein [Cellulosilyticum sp. I15G10I2]|uniref:zf-HC2 domain-containing protein n=1 Tax=Cellulosilyticum sp. I15G10I2 TaxID=1892843 RepID=UPI00085CCF2C|nr:zf-HC2 domain-containing protein [Cellulosilyticum sp. I15G10I2]